MLRNYFTIAYRNLLKHKFYTAINIFGLVAGLASCFLIVLYVIDELSFDQWIPDAKNIYRYEEERTNSTGEDGLLVKSALRAKRDLQEYFPEVEAATRIIDQTVVLGFGDEEYFETVWFVDQSFLQVFDLSLVSGNRSSALNDKLSILLSETMAEKYFGDVPAVGSLLRLDDQRDYQVSGVFEDLPLRSHLELDFLLPYDQNDSLYSFNYSESWDAVEGYTYLKLIEGADMGSIRQQLPQFLRNYFPADSIPTGLQLSDFRRPRLSNILDIHLDPGGLGNIKAPGNKQLLISLSLIALSVLSIACINFVNLSTIRSMSRAKEVSIRKVVGAGKGQLSLQFIGEAVLVSLIALAIAIGLVEIVLPYYNSLLNRDVSVQYFSAPTFFLSMLFVAIVIGIVSGIHPALKLSSHQPANVLRSGLGGTTRVGWTQPVLVTLQFAISVALIITTIVIFSQQAFIDDKDLGFLPDDKLIIRNMNEEFSRDSKEIFTSQLRSLPAVIDTTFSTATPSDLVASGFTRIVTVPGYQEDSFSLYPKSVAANFFDVYGIPLIQGRHFNEELESDRFSWRFYSADQSAQTRNASVIVNSTAVKRIGFASAEDAIGKTIQLSNIRLEIIGVVADAHFRSLREAITPIMYIFSPDDFLSLTLSHVANAEIQQLVTDVTEIWDELIPGFPINLEFLKTNIEAQYTEDRLQSLLMTIFASLAISIACMGLYALAAYSTLQRTREIGIRKVHGALGIDIVKILLLQLSKPIMLANFFAWPVAFYAISQYLNTFQYRIEVGPAIFLASSLVALVLAWSAIIYHAVKASNGNSVSALRSSC